jgi:hypothetical protein
MKVRWNKKRDTHEENNLDLAQLTVGSSILLTTTTNLATPSVLARRTCSLVWPPFSYPVSNSPFLADMTFIDKRRKRRIAN